jgi:hypothetical protein
VVDRVVVAAKVATIRDAVARDLGDLEELCAILAREADDAGS